MKKLIFLWWMLLAAAPLTAQDDKPELNIKHIPDSLKADAVIRHSRRECRLSSGNSTVEHRFKRTVTAFTKDGLAYTLAYIVKDPYTRINYMRGKIYDAEGSFVRKLNEDEFIKTDFGDNSTFIDDITHRVIASTYRDIPFTIELDYAYEVKNDISLPFWRPRKSKASVQKAEFVVYGSPGSFRSKTFNIPNSADKGKKGASYYKWEVSNLKPKKPLSFMPPGEYEYPGVLLSPKRIKMGGQSWSTNSWEDIGRWYYELNLNRTDFSKKQIKEIKERVQGLTSPREKALALYRYMQENMRYVNIALGIGGHQARFASEVEENGYGDCKGLTNYLYSCLKINGVESYPVLVNAGDDAHFTAVEDFPAPYFNHVFLMVPTEQDTLWIECTNSTLSPEYTNSFTDDRFVLLTAEEGGRLLKTPETKAEQNLLSRRVSVTINPDGSAKGKSTGLHKGFFYGETKRFNETVSESYLRKQIMRSAEVSEFRISDIRFRDQDKAPFEYEQTIEFTARRFGKKSGSRVFLTPWLFDDELLDFDEDFEDREFDFYLKRSKTISEVYEFRIPDRMEVEHLPEPTDREFAFGHYKRSYKQEGDKLIVKRTFTLRKGRYKPEVGKQLSELREIFRKHASDTAILKSEF